MYVSIESIRASVVALRDADFSVSGTIFGVVLVLGVAREMVFVVSSAAATSSLQCFLDD